MFSSKDTTSVGEHPVQLQIFQLQPVFSKVLHLEKEWGTILVLLNMVNCHPTQEFQVTYGELCSVTSIMEKGCEYTWFSMMVLDFTYGSVLNEIRQVCKYNMTTEC